MRALSRYRIVALSHCRIVVLSHVRMVASPFVRGFPSFEIEIEIELPFVQQRSFISLHEHESNRPSLTVDVEAEARLGVHPIEPTQLATVARG